MPNLLHTVVYFLYTPFYWYMHENTFTLHPLPGSAQWIRVMDKGDQIRRQLTSLLIGNTNFYHKCSVWCHGILWSRSSPEECEQVASVPSNCV